jgi:ABC-type lipoprotein export system ATPase subunit
VQALDNVNICFEDKGMVFVLGKSGSGKSTLLNLMGGLDGITSGEIYIKGKSSKDFSQSDFDSYRNTFIGFIFQEYNILSEFSVAKNIALALELQGKKADKEAVDALLEQVDLIGYGNRRPAELSGGQKQRVAIARALIKDPEIIMADEPTGALDSATGRQVFETLQKLSKTKLVIIISHDREYAEYYGDRVIEFADGRVISDIKKYRAESESVSAGVSVIDNSILYVKGGHKLSADEKTAVIRFIEDVPDDIIVSKDGKSNGDFRKQARIDSNGNKESFENTSEKNLRLNEYDAKQFKLIRSRLPYRHSLKIGASSLKSKPVRLVFTILLSAIAFALFGLSDTMGAYNKYDAAYNSIREVNIEYAAFTKGVNMNPDPAYTPYYTATAMTDGDFDMLRAEFPDYTFDKIYPMTSGYYGFDEYLYENSSKNMYEYYATTFAGITESSEAAVAAHGFSLTGEYPDSTDEIAVTQYVYNTFYERGYAVTNPSTGAKTKLPITKKEDLIGKSLRMYDMEFTITGVIDTKLDLTRYESLKSGVMEGLGSIMLASEFQAVKEYSFHAAVFIANGTIDALMPKLPVINSYDINKFMEYLTKTGDFYSLQFLAAFTPAAAEQTAFFDGAKTALDDDEVLLDWQTFSEYTGDVLDGNALYNAVLVYVDGIYRNAPNAAELKTAVKTWLKRRGLDEADATAEAENYYNYYELLNSELYYDNPYGLSGREIEFICAREIIRDTYAGAAVAFNYSIRDYSGRGTAVPVQETKKIAGIYFSSDKYASDRIIVFSKPVLDALAGEIGTIKLAITTFKGSRSDDMKLLRFSYEDNDNVRFSMQNAVSSSLENINSMIEAMASAFLYVGLGFAIFAALLLLNFIAVSISYKKREIGILRAVGARSSDVFGIFFNESLIIALISFAAALTGTIIAVFFLDRLMQTELGLLIKILTFGIRQAGLMLGVSVVTALAASFFPVNSIARKKPIDAIKSQG